VVDCKPSAAGLFSEKDLSEDEAVQELTRLLRQSIARRMVSDVPFGVLLSVEWTRRSTWR